MMNQYIKYYGILSALFVFVCTAHARPALTIYPYLDDEFREQMLSLDGQPAFLKKFTSREVISNLNFPYEILYGPDK